MSRFLVGVVVGATVAAAAYNLARAAPDILSAGGWCVYGGARYSDSHMEIWPTRLMPDGSRACRLDDKPTWQR